jgi:DNA polymerase I
MNSRRIDMATLPTTLIIDGNNLAHRVRHTVSLSNKGVDVSVTYGFIRNIVSLYDKFKPNSIMVCWDGGVPNFRRVAVPEYKASRDHGDPDEYADFLRQVQELSDYAFPMMGVVSVRKIGSEADDLMYHASKMLVGKAIIVSTDKDMLQCIDQHTMVYMPFTDKLYGKMEFEAEYNIDLKDYIHWRALVGDGSDNIAGVHGVGEKTATKLFHEYGSLIGITNAALGINPDGKLTGAIGEAIVNFGYDRISKNIFVMALYADRVGARASVIEAVKQYKPANKDRIRKYFMRNAFASLVGSCGTFDRLTVPKLNTTNLRTPVIHGRRVPA